MNGLHTKPGAGSLQAAGGVVRTEASERGGALGQIGEQLWGAWVCRSEAHLLDGSGELNQSLRTLESDRSARTRASLVVGFTALDRQDCI